MMSNSSRRWLASLACALGAAAWAGGSSQAQAQCVGYTITQTTGTIDPGTTDTGNHVDDGLTAITLPFSWTLLGTSYTQASVCSNGNVQFGTPSGTFTNSWTNECLPSSGAIAGPTIFPHWDDLMTNGTGGGIFTSTTGVAPNRIFNIEWRAGYYPTTTPTLNFEVRLFEGQGRFDIVYGAIPNGGSSATVGVQSGSSGPVTQYSCNAGGITQGTVLRFDCTSSGAPICGLSVNPNTGGIAATFTATCTVTPGVGPPSTGLGVSLNATSVDGGMVTLHDDGIPPDTTAGDNVFTGTVTVGLNATNGLKTLISTVSDAQGRSSSCNTTYNVNTVPLSGTGSASPASVFNCGPTNSLLTVNVTPASGPPASSGIAVTADLSTIGGSVTQVFYNDGTHGDATAGDNIFSYAAAIPAGLPNGARSLPFTVTDAQSRSASGNISLTISPCPTSGPDVYVGGLTDVGYFGFVGASATDPGAIYAYAVGTNACNAGDTPVGWYNGTNRHPVIAQAIYRLKNGRFEQMGQSWLKHGFASTNSNFCGICQYPPDGGAQLGVQCSDAYGSGLNGSQGYLGPRSEVNATTGSYPWPHSSPTDTSVIGGRLQIHWPDVDPAQNAGARYFAEGHYVTADDATFVNAGANIHGNGLNNATWREISMSNPSAGSIPFIGNDHPMQHGIMAWQSIDNTVVLANADYMDTNITARFFVGAKVTNNGNGTWTYEYAVANMNADRAGGTFTVPLPANAVVTNIGFHDVDSHSGEPYSLTDWTSSVSSGAISWTTQTYAQNVNANALRWGTMYNYRFTANVAPSNAGMVTVGLFKPATAGSPATSASATVPAPTVPHCGSADFNCDGDTGTDADIESFFLCLSGTCPALPCTSTADFNGDGDTGTDADIEAFFRVLGGGTC
jgi:hypothetical protein